MNHHGPVRSRGPSKRGFQICNPVVASSKDYGQSLCSGHNVCLACHKRQDALFPGRQVFDGLQQGVRRGLHNGALDVVSDERHSAVAHIAREVHTWIIECERVLAVAVALGLCDGLDSKGGRGTHQKKNAGRIGKWPLPDLPFYRKMSMLPSDDDRPIIVLPDDVVRTIVELGIGQRRCDWFTVGGATRRGDVDWTREPAPVETSIVRFLKQCRLLSRQFRRIASAYIRRVSINMFTTCLTYKDALRVFPGAWIFNYAYLPDKADQDIDHRDLFEPSNAAKVLRYYFTYPTESIPHHTHVYERDTSFYSRLRYRGIARPRSYFDPAIVVEIGAECRLAWGDMKLWISGKPVLVSPLESSLPLVFQARSYIGLGINECDAFYSESITVPVNLLEHHGWNLLAVHTRWVGHRFPPLVIYLNGYRAGGKGSHDPWAPRVRTYGQLPRMIQDRIQAWWLHSEHRPRVLYDPTDDQEPECLKNPVYAGVPFEWCRPQLADVDITDEFYQSCKDGPLPMDGGAEELV